MRWLERWYDRNYRHCTKCGRLMGNNWAGPNTDMWYCPKCWKEGAKK